MTKRSLAGMALAGALATGVACSPGAETTNTGPTNTAATNAAGSNANTNAAETTQTFEKGTAQYIATHQPDYQATVTLQNGPTKLAGKIAKVGENWRIEGQLPVIGRTITFERAGQPTIMILADKKQYVEYTDEADINPLTRTVKGLTQSGVKFEKVGSEVVDGHSTTKYRGTKEGETGELVLYSANDLQDLIIRIDGQKENVTFNATWTDIALNPPADVVQPPADLATAYKKVDMKDFTSMFSAGAGDQAAVPAKQP